MVVLHPIVVAVHHQIGEVIQLLRLEFVHLVTLVVDSHGLYIRDGHSKRWLHLTLSEQGAARCQVHLGRGRVIVALVRGRAVITHDATGLRDR